MDGVGQALDKLTAIATMVGEAETDDAATVPADLGALLKTVADQLSGMASQYAPEAPAPEAEGAPADAASTPPEEQQMSLAGAPGTAPAAKAALLPAPLREGENMTPLKDSLSMAPKTMAAIGQLYSAFGDELIEAAKAGRKIKGARYQKLSELHTTLGSLLNELAYDEALPETFEGPAGKEKAKKSAAPATNPVDAKLAELLALAKTTAEKVAAHDAAIAKINRTPEAPRAREVEGGGAPPSAVLWPADMSAALAKRKAAR